MKYIWRKRAGAHWLRIRNEDVTRRFGGALAIVERPRGKRALLEISCRTEEQARELVSEFGGSVEKLRPDWLQHFMKQAQAKPLRIGSRLVILRTPEKDGPALPANSARRLVIPAEAAFGTGEHATTTLCLRLLERITRHFPPGWTMLDAGTGSGILAIAGSYFGARRVLAIDSDPLACATAKRNVRENRAQNIMFVSGDVLKQNLSGNFDVITGNLFSEVLIKALPVWTRHLAPGSHLILSGILRSQESAVIRALWQHSLVVSEIRRRGKWSALLCRDGSDPRRPTY